MLKVWKVQYFVYFKLRLLESSSLPAESRGQPDWQHGGGTVGEGGGGQAGYGGGRLAEQLGDHPARGPVLRGGGGAWLYRRARRPQGRPEWQDG